ncbi:MAG: hypothetical protein BroJett014_11350 [Planctomycetota bacterium]|nr:hypothetical protein [Planctomycetota bacterium]GIK52162.1 MAG: hypothetical protein BroJett014_11350 [Planctomycetota bacterium]
MNLPLLSTIVRSLEAGWLVYLVGFIVTTAGTISVIRLIGELRIDAKFWLTWLLLVTTLVLTPLAFFGFFLCEIAPDAPVWPYSHAMSPFEPNPWTQFVFERRSVEATLVHVGRCLSLGAFAGFVKAAE